MKSFINSLAIIAVLILPFEANASLIELGSINVPGNQSFSNTNSGNIADEITFTLTEDSIVTISLTNAFLSVFGTNINEIQNFSAGLTGPDNANLDQSISDLANLPAPVTGKFQVLSFGGVLSTGDYVLDITGNAPSGASYGGNIAVASAAPLSSVPVPAALWLFGSAIVGMFGLKQTKKAFTS